MSLLSQTTGADLVLRGNIEKWPSRPGVSFLGRLGTYRYLDMDQVIGEALDFAASFLLALEKKTPLPLFTGEAQ